MKRYYFGLDLSLNSTGIAVFTDDARFVECSTIAIDRTSPIMGETKNKLKFIGRELLKYKREYKPEFIVIERGFMRFIKSTAQLMRVHGLVNYLFSDMEQYEIPATSVKLALTGRGNAEKEEVARAVLKLYPNITFETTDESDACAVAICWAIKQKWLNAINK